MSPKATNDDDCIIGERIRRCRIAKGLSQTELAAKLGITFQQLQKYEKGKNRISASRLQAVARALGVPVTTFLDQGTPERARPTDPDLLRLNRAFAAIADDRLRAQALGLLETIAKIGE